MPHSAGELILKTEHLQWHPNRQVVIPYFYGPFSSRGIVRNGRLVDIQSIAPFSDVHEKAWSWGRDLVMDVRHSRLLFLTVESSRRRGFSMAQENAFLFGSGTS